MVPTVASLRTQASKNYVIGIAICMDVCMYVCMYVCVNFQFHSVMSFSWAPSAQLSSALSSSSLDSR